MRNNARHLLASELSAATVYLDRLYQALVELSSMNYHPKVRSVFEQLFFDLTGVLEKTLLSQSIAGNTSTQLLTNKIIKDKIKTSNKLIEAMLALDFNEAITIELVINYINTIYKYSYKLHLIVKADTNLDVQFPRMNMLEIDKDITDESMEKPKVRGHLREIKGENYTQDQESEKPLLAFRLNSKTVDEFIEANGNLINSIEWQRDKKYEQLISQGHEAIFNKNYVLAIEHFTKAQNYKDTAEILTLLGWSYSLKGDLEQAKEFCLKAIRNDADYGPPYNDLGNYLLTEGEVKESLKWFNLAKKAPNYQNREYPYINAGRAHMAMKNFKLALSEFSKALTLAPYHEELHDTVTKLKQSIEKNSTSNNNLNLKTPLNNEEQILE